MSNSQWHEDQSAGARVEAKWAEQKREEDQQVERLKAAMAYAAAELRHAYRAKDDWNLVARAIEILERGAR